MECPWISQGLSPPTVDRGVFVFNFLYKDIQDEGTIPEHHNSMEIQSYSRSIIEYIRPGIFQIFQNESTHSQPTRQ